MNYTLSIKRYEYVLAGMLVFLPCIFGTACAQDNFSVTNYFTEQYRDFPMMKISIVPPPGFEKDTDEIGFINRKYSAAIRAGNMKLGISKAIDSFAKSFDTVSRRDSLGMTLMESYPFAINKFTARLARLYGRVEDDNYYEWRLFIGDTATTYIIKGFLPARKKNELDRAMRAALLSVFYEPTRRILPPGSDYTTTFTSGCGCSNKK